MKTFEIKELFSEKRLRHAKEDGLRLKRIIQRGRDPQLKVEEFMRQLRSKKLIIDESMISALIDVDEKNSDDPVH